MSNYFIGEIKTFGFNFAPKAWAQCNGQLLAINTNTALFSILGTTYGGNGVNNFALPDLRGRTPVHWGQSPGLSNVVLGQISGLETVNLTSAQMPAHTHGFQASTAAGTKKPIANAIFADDVDTQAVDYFAPFNAPNSSYVQLHPLSVTSLGGSQPHSNLQPYLVINYCIALQGIFPSRN
jgi:microcystin-dependent protein